MGETGGFHMNDRARSGDREKRTDGAPSRPGPGMEGAAGEGRRLIEAVPMHHGASSAGRSERYRRGETPHTVLVWWARRPHAAMRLLVYATVSRDLSAESVETMEGLSVYEDEEAVARARRLVKRGYGRRIPRVLDMFGGGGTIPYEALNLGLDVHSVDSNELSVFVQRTVLQYVDGAGERNLPDGEIVGGGLASGLRRAGWSDEDVAAGLVANGAALVSNAERVDDADDAAALLMLERAVAGECPGFRFSRRRAI